jgi:radical S-adenosyl methionine domain-containing protein 2
MACRYCFAQFDDQVPQLRRDKAELRSRALMVVRAAAEAGIDKLTFVGGEPTLCPWLGDLLRLASGLGMVTMVVTNGSRLDRQWLDQHGEHLHWVALSVDSLDADTNRVIGRTVDSAGAADAGHYLRLFELLGSAGVRTKMNTVVSARNWEEDFRSFLLRAGPARWKVFQALPIQGQNDSAFPEFAVSEAQFRAFVARHEEVASTLTIAAESNDEMLGSYLMVDPLGRFVTNMSGIYRYSKPIWDVGWDAAIADTQVDVAKFLGRGGLYKWRE